MNQSTNPLKNLKAIWKWLHQEFILWLTTIPPLIALTLYLLLQYTFHFENNNIIIIKIMEVLHPAILFLFLCTTAYSWKNYHTQGFKWTTITAAALFMREIHFKGSDIIVYTTLILSWGLAWRQPKYIVDLFSHKIASSCFVMGFLSYVCSESFDRRIFERFFKIYLNNYSYRIPHSSRIEESLETLGGLFLLLSAITLLIHWHRNSQEKSSPSPEYTPAKKT